MRKQGEVGMPVSGLIRKVGLAEQIFSRWKQRDAGLELARVRQLKPRDEENACLTRLVRDFTLDQVMVPGVLLKQFSSPRARAPWGSSCGATIWSASCGPAVQPGVRNRRLAIVAAKIQGRCSGQRTHARARVAGRYGSRQIQGWLNRESWAVGMKLVARLS